jgi:hypothetical protein
MKNVIKRFTSIVSAFVLTMVLVLSSASGIFAASIEIQRDSDGNISSISIGSVTYDDMDSAKAALKKLGMTDSQIEQVFGSSSSSGTQSIFFGNSTDISDYTYMTRSKAQSRMNAYKNNEVFWGEEYIYYDGSPLEDFDNRMHGVYHTYSSYADATHQAVSTSYQINDQYSGTHLYSVVIESWDKKMNESQYNSAIASLKNIAAQYNSGSTYDKIYNVAEYVASSISYDYTKTFGDIYHAVNNGIGVCTAYAECFQLCMENLGIESYIFTDRTHALNVVNLDGTYYYVDCTNMSDSSGIRWQFFLFGTNMRTNHTTLPISSTSYDGYAGNYGIDNLENEERVETSEIKEFINDVVQNIETPNVEVAVDVPATDAETEAPTEEETTTEAETTTAATTAVQTTVATTSSQTTAEDVNVSSSSHSVTRAVVIVVICVVLIAATVGVTVNYNKKNYSKKDDDDSNGMS